MKEIKHTLHSELYSGRTKHQVHQVDGEGPTLPIKMSDLEHDPKQSWAFQCIILKI